MIKREQLLKRPNYLLTKYQNEIYRQLVEYMKERKISQSEIAQKLDVSNSYVSQILNGDFNFTLKKIIELALMIGKVPHIEFLSITDYWLKEDNKIFVPDINGVLRNAAQGMLCETGKKSDLNQSTMFCTVGGKEVKQSVNASLLY